MNKKNEVPVSSVPEVQAFENAKARLEAFKASNRAFFDYLEPLIEEYNNARQAADKAVRARSVSCGSFQINTITTKYDADELYKWAGREKFLELGGSISTVQTLEVDKKKVDMYIAAGEIPEDVARVVRVSGPTFKKVEPLVLP